MRSLFLFAVVASGLLLSGCSQSSSPREPAVQARAVNGFAEAHLEDKYRVDFTVACPPTMLVDGEPVECEVTRPLAATITVAATADSTGSVELSLREQLGITQRQLEEFVAANVMTSNHSVACDGALLAVVEGQQQCSVDKPKFGDKFSVLATVSSLDEATGQPVVELSYGAATKS